MKKRESKLDRKEKELIDSIESGEWKSVKNVDDSIKKFAQYAKNTLKKDNRISIRISKQDFIGIQTRAVEEGMPYQTLITSVVHKFVTNRLVPKVYKKETVRSKAKKR